MSGILAASPFTYNKRTYQGIAPGAKIIPLKVSDPTGAYSLTFAKNVEKALKWVEANRAKYNIGIVSMSIRTPLADYNATYADEVKRLGAAGVFIAAAAGQEDPNLDVEYPARDANVFGVSVVTANDTFPTDELNRGPGIDLLAPGDTLPILLRGSGATVSAMATSYATPFAAGAAALLKQVKGSFNAADITSILKTSGKNVTDTSKGFAHSGLTYKRLDLNEAVKLGITRAGTAATGTISGTVFHDANGNTKQDSTEKQALAATVFLDLNNNTVLDRGEPSTTSNKRSGVFTFSDVAVGTYAVRQLAPLKTRQTYPRKYFSVAVTANHTSSGLLFGDTYLAFISGVVFNDANENGVQDSGETGLANRRVYLDLNRDGVYQSTEPSVLSDSGGNVIFNSVNPGSYVIRIADQSGWTATNVTSYAVGLKAGRIKRGAFFGQHA
jgi:ribosomal protein L12E/L44/L45/RPP1/RPP2